MLYGYILVFLSLTVGSLRPVLMQLGLNLNYVTTFQLLIISSIIGGLLVFLTPNHLKFSFKNFFKPALCGILLYLNSFFTILALNHMSVISVSIIVALTPLLVDFHNSYLNKKPLPKKNFLGFAISFVGVMLVLNVFSVQGFFFNYEGCFFSVLAIITSDIYRISIQQLTQEYSSRSVSAFVLLTGLLISLVFLPFNVHTYTLIKPDAWLILFFIGVSIYLANLFFVKAIHLLGSSKVSMLYISRPIFVLVLAMIILSSSCSFYQLTGIFITMAGLFVYESKIINI